MISNDQFRKRLAELFRSQNLATLATHNDGQPYASLVAFYAADDLKHIYFVTPKTTRKFANFDGLSDKWNTGAEYVSLYPNVLLGVHRDHTFAIMLDPQSHDQTIERVEIFYATEGMCGPEMADLRQKNAKMWKDIFTEDIFVVEGMQKGRSASLYDGGKFSPVMDVPTYCFHEWVARRFTGK